METQIARSKVINGHSVQLVITGDNSENVEAWANFFANHGGCRPPEKAKELMKGGFEIRFITRIAKVLRSFESSHILNSDNKYKGVKGGAKLDAAAIAQQRFDALPEVELQLETWEDLQDVTGYRIGAKDRAALAE